MSKSKKLLPSATHAERIMGRHVVDDDTGAVLVDWPGVRLDFGGITNTKSVSIRMNGNLAVFGYRIDEEGEENERNAVNDDDDDNDAMILVTSITQKDHVLATTLEKNKSYRVSLWKRDDPMNGGATICGVVIDADGKGKQRRKEEVDSLFAERRNKRLIEFVGDSDTVAFGVHGDKSSFLYFVCCQLALMTTAHQLRKSTDVTRSWAHLTAQQLEADYSIVAWSGIGVKWSPVDGVPNMIDAYSAVLPSTSSLQTTHVEPKDAPYLGPLPSVVILYIGQNDEDATTKEEKLQKAFVALLRKIRQYRPSPIPIVIIVPALDCKLACAFGGAKENTTTAKRQNKVWKQAAQELQTEDPHLHVLEHKHEPDIALNSKDDYAICLHWNAASNRKWADPLVPKLKQLLMW